MAKYSRLPKKRENGKVRLPALCGFTSHSSSRLFLLGVCGIEGVLVNFFSFFLYVDFLVLYSKSPK